MTSLNVNKNITSPPSAIATGPITHVLLHPRVPTHHRPVLWRRLRGRPIGTSKAVLQWSPIHARRPSIGASGGTGSARGRPHCQRRRTNWKRRGALTVIWQRRLPGHLLALSRKHKPYKCKHLMADIILDILLPQICCCNLIRSRPNATSTSGDFMCEHVREGGDLPVQSCGPHEMIGQRSQFRHGHGCRAVWPLANVARRHPRHSPKH